MRNGLWCAGAFQPWEDFHCFEWIRNEKYGVELKLVAKWKSGGSRSPRLVVPREDREAVQRLLKANLPDLNNDSDAYLA